MMRVLQKQESLLAQTETFFRRTVGTDSSKMPSLGRGVPQLFWVLFLVCSLSEAAPPCKKLGETCIEGPSTKIIQGISVTRPCWKYQAEFECATNQYQNFCAGLEQIKGCTLVNQTCVETDTDSVCKIWDKRFVCGSLLDKREDIVHLDSSYTIVKNVEDTKACEVIEQNPNCTLAKETCVEDEATRIINGKPVHKTCWRKEREYACLGEKQSDCHEIPKHCEKIKSTCLSFDDKNPQICLAWEHQYRCPEKDTISAPVAVDCSGQKFCVNGNCYDTGYQNNPDFAKAVSQLSVLKDMQQKFDPNSLSLFQGTPNDCRKWPLNAMNCCSNKGWARDRLASCNDHEKQLHQQQQEGLIHEVGSYCSKKKFGKICLEKKRSFCVFDSKLARIVHEQGRGQIGLSWGEPESPNCRGFTPQELQKLNFEQMNLSEYYQDIWRQTQAPNQTPFSQHIGERVQSYYSQGVAHAQ